MKGERGRSHPLRTTLSEYIVDNPGVSFRTLLTAFDLNESTLRYHLDCLIRSGVVTSQRTGGSKLFFPSITHDRIGKDTAEKNGSSRNVQRILNVIRDEPNIDRSRLKVMLHIPSRELTRIISELKDRNLIWEHRSDGVSRYEAVTREKVLRNALVILVTRLLDREIDEATFLRLKDEIERQIDECP